MRSEFRDRWPISLMHGSRRLIFNICPFWLSFGSMHIQTPSTEDDALFWKNVIIYSYSLSLTSIIIFLLIAPPLFFHFIHIQSVMVSSALDCTTEIDDLILRQTQIAHHLKLLRQKRGFLQYYFERNPYFKGRKDRQTKHIDSYVQPSRCKVGSPGNSGSPGRPGKNGINGNPGKNGINGQDGDSYEPQFCYECPMGIIGDPGPPGPKGPTGPPGIPGIQGRSGVSIKGEKGRPGTPGKPGNRGSIGPRGTPGTIMNSVGPSVQTGKPGLPGKPGTDGQPGLPGKKRNGRKGAPGNPGASGPRGKQGSAGAVGIAGEPGKPGGCTECPPARTPPGY